MDFLRDKQLDRRAPSDWGIRFPPDIHPGAAREALALLLQANVSSYAILRVFQAFGVVFEDKTLFVVQADSHRVDPFRLLGIAVALGAGFAALAVIVELAILAVAAI
jgi:hypothetical protein